MRFRLLEFQIRLSFPRSQFLRSQGFDRLCLVALMNLCLQVLSLVYKVCWSLLRWLLMWWPCRICYRFKVLGLPSCSSFDLQGTLILCDLSWIETCFEGLEFEASLRGRRWGFVGRGLWSLLGMRVSCPGCIARFPFRVWRFVLVGEGACLEIAGWFLLCPCWRCWSFSWTLQFLFLMLLSFARLFLFHLFAFAILLHIIAFLLRINHCWNSDFACFSWVLISNRRYSLFISLMGFSNFDLVFLKQILRAYLKALPSNMLVFSFCNLIRPPLIFQACIE